MTPAAFLALCQSDPDAANAMVARELGWIPPQETDPLALTDYDDECHLLYWHRPHRCGGFEHYSVTTTGPKHVPLAPPYVTGSDWAHFGEMFEAQEHGPYFCRCLEEYDDGGGKVCATWIARQRHLNRNTAMALALLVAAGKVAQ